MYQNECSNLYTYDTDKLIHDPCKVMIESTPGYWSRVSIIDKVEVSFSSNFQLKLNSPQTCSGEPRHTTHPPTTTGVPRVLVQFRGFSEAS